MQKTGMESITRKRDPADRAQLHTELCLQARTSPCGTEWLQLKLKTAFSWQIYPSQNAKMILYLLPKWISRVAQLVKNLPAMQETPVQFMGREVPLEKGQATHSVFLGFPGGSDGRESACNVGDLDSISGFGRFPGGGHGNPLQYSFLENPHGQRSLASYGVAELDMTV